MKNIKSAEGEIPFFLFNEYNLFLHIFHNSGDTVFREG